MSRIAVVLSLGIVLVSAGCGYGSHNYMNGNRMPQIMQLMPASKTAGAGAFVLTVNGTGFGTDSVVYWGMMTRMTTHVSTTQVTADITAADVASAGTVQVYVHSGGTNSNAVAFTIQ